MTGLALPGRARAGVATGAEDAVRVRRRITLAVLVANFGAAVLLLVLLVFLVPQPDDEIGEAVAWFVLVTAASLGGGGLLGRWLFRPVERWLAADRPPTPAEEARVVGGPRLVAVLTFGFWAAAAVSVGTAEAIDGGPALAGIRDSIAILAGGLMSTAITYLLVEQQTRPLVRAVLAGRAPDQQRSLGLRPRLLLAWALGSGVPLAAILVGELSVGDTDPRISADAAVFLTALGLLSGAATTIVAVRSVADPIADVRRALGIVQRGDLDVAVPVDDAGEIGQLQAGVNEMVAGLQERQRLADLFGRHVGGDVARRALEDGVRLGGERRDASALFVDLRDSTALAARSTPEEVVAILNRFFGEVVRAVSAESGWVNKFEGDGAMCIFGAPIEQPDHAGRALRAARVLQQRLADAGLRAAIGVSSGDVVAGNVGAEERYEYTVIGDPVNEAARLTDAAKDHDGHVLASGCAVERAGEEATSWRRVGVVELRGRAEATELYAPIP